MPYLEENGPQFSCPICRSGYFQVVVVQKNGGAYKTDFHQCSGCTVMFRDPVKFTLFKPYVYPAPTEQHQKKEEARRAYFEGREPQ